MVRDHTLEDSTSEGSNRFTASVSALWKGVEASSHVRTQGTYLLAP